MTPWQRRWRRLRRGSLGLLALAIILAGLAVAALGRLLPMLESRPQAVAAWLSERLQQPVSVDNVHAAWNGRGVVFDLGGLRLGSAEGLRIDRARLQIDVVRGLLPGEPLTSLRISSPRLELQRGAEGSWRVAGLGVTGGQLDPAEQLQQLERLGELVLDGARIVVDDRQRDQTWTLPPADARLRTQGGRVRLALYAYPPGEAPLRLNLDLAPGLHSGLVYLQARGSRIDRLLQPWLPEGRSLPPLRADLALWARLQDDVWQTLTLQLAAEAVPSAPAQPVLSAGPPPLPPPLRLGGHWQRNEAGGGLAQLWQHAAPGWLQLEHLERQWTLEAGELELAAWLPWAAYLADAQAAGSGWALQLQQAAPRGRLRGLRVQGDASQPPRLSGWISGLGLQPVGNRPGASGIDLAWSGEGERIGLQLRAAPLRFDWPVALREVMTPAVQGELLLWRDPLAAWCLSALDLQLTDPAYALAAEGDLCFDGGAPKVDLRVAVAPADITVAKKFWILHRMPPPAVRWLDAALQGGRLQRGELLLHGDLADWPFRNQAGRFEASAELADLQLAFRPDWPPAHRLGGVARFINDGMEVELQAEVAGIQAERVRGGIAHFRDAVLQLDIDGAADAGAMLELLRVSPLWPRLAVGLEQVSLRGPGRIDLELAIPLKAEAGEPQVDGRVELQGADLRHAGWGLAFDAAQGELRFSERGVQLRELPVLLDGRRASFSLAVGSFAVDPAHQVEAALSGRLGIQSLLDTQPELAWLKRLLDGASTFAIDLAVPAAAGAAPRLRLRSDLVGAALELPAPLRKSPATPMPLELQIDLSAPKVVDLQLGELLRLRGVSGDDDPFTGVAAFGDIPPVERPARGIAVRGQVPVIDVDGWLALAASDAEDGLIDSVALDAGELAVLGRSFAETELAFTQQAGDKRIALAGPTLQGEILIPLLPELPQRGITARFERLHWPAGDETAAAAAEQASAFDPRRVPALHVHASDLRLGEARLGETRLESFPTAAGMRIEQFTTRSPDLQLSARGDWTLQQGVEQSQFELEFTAENLGAMLKALGFSELVDGGQTMAQLSAQWRGAPSAFNLAAADGQLQISVGKGRIPEVSPGAGRLFGLFSLSQIPRRLALDFSDFFGQGLAFDRIEGQFRLGAGGAETDQLLIDSPAAEIRIRGRTGLADQSYAQTMEVLPRAGSVLPVVGALAAGPAGAALGAVAQAVLQKPFKQMTRTLYRVEGSWAEPKISVIERGPAKPSAEQRKP